MTWTTLGTAGGPVPAVDRSEPANLLQVGNIFVLVDAGDGSVNALAKVGVDISRVRAVFISHHHGDHFGGLFAVIAAAMMTSYPGVLDVYGPPGTQEMVRGLVVALQPLARAGYGFGHLRAPGEVVRSIEIKDGDQLHLGPLTVSAAANSHFSDENGADAGASTSLSYRFDFESRSVTYTGDTGPSGSVTKLAQGTELLVSEVMDYDRLIVSMSDLKARVPQPVFDQMALHIRTHHLTGAQVGNIAARASVRQVLLTHFATSPVAASQSASDIVRGIRSEFQGPVSFGRDLGSIDVGCSAKHVGASP